jgi:hypothetical protein
MTRRSRVWPIVALLAAVIFILVNLGGGIYAAAQGEPLHAGIHAALLLLGGYAAWRFAPRREAGGHWRWGALASPAASPEFTDRLTHLEQSVDAVAVEVERIGEGQRFVTRLITEDGAPQVGGVGAAEPIALGARDAAPRAGRP